MLNKPTSTKPVNKRTAKRKPRGANKLLRKFARSESGVSAIEMALVTPVLLIVFMGLIDYGIAIFSKMELTGAVRSGAQYALIKSNDMDAIETTVINSSNLDVDNIAVTTPYETCECSDGTLDATCTTTCSADTLRHYIVISATYTYVPFFLPNNIVLDASSTIRIE